MDIEEPRLTEYQKWDYIVCFLRQLAANLKTLKDFHARGCGAFFSYIWLWFLAIIAVVVYGLDTYIAVNLLAFDRWSSQFEPYIPLEIAKWVFAGCILLSWLLCGYEWFRAIRVMRRGNVAESYLDPLAVVVQSMRPLGWKRFLVFAELTKSKKGADYVALFTYFQFKGAIRVILAEGPRQVINALTLYSVVRGRLVPSKDRESHDSPFIQFWDNVGSMYDEAPEQAIVLATMLFTLSIWIFSALSLLVACILWATFLSHYLPREAGSLKAYCRHKVDKRLARVVNITARMALERVQQKREKQADVSIRPLQREPTLPFSEASTISRQPTLTETPFTQSQDGGAKPFMRQPILPTVRQPTLPLLDEKQASSAVTRQLPLEKPSREPTLPDLAPKRQPTVVSEQPAPAKSLLARKPTLQHEYSDSLYPLLESNTDREPRLPRIEPQRSNTQDSVSDRSGVTNFDFVTDELALPRTYTPSVYSSASDQRAGRVPDQDWTITSGHDALWREYGIEMQPRDARQMNNGSTGMLHDQSAAGSLSGRQQFERHLARPQAGTTFQSSYPAANVTRPPRSMTGPAPGAVFAETGLTRSQTLPFRRQEEE